MGHAQIKAADWKLAYIYIVMWARTIFTWSCTQVIFLYMFSFICIILPCHSPPPIVTTVTTTPTPCCHITNTTTRKKVIGMIFFYHFHFTDNILGAIDNVNDRTAPPPFPPPHQHNTFQPPPHQCVRHHHYYHPISTCHKRVPVTRWCVFHPPPPPMSLYDSLVGFFGLSTHHITHYHHQRVLMTRWWVYLVSPPLGTAFSLDHNTHAAYHCHSATNESLWLVGRLFCLSTHITHHHHHHQQVLMTRWWPSPPSPSTMTLTMATNKSQWLVGGLGGLRCDASQAPGIFLFFILYILLTIIYSKLHVWTPTPRPLNTRFRELGPNLVNFFYFPSHIFITNYIYFRYYYLFISQPEIGPKRQTHLWLAYHLGHTRLSCQGLQVEIQMWNIFFNTLFLL